jgi:membrane protein implicated in regulation of membrane protease activity
MSISLSTPAPEQVRRLEAAAAARPGLYRLRLALLAIVGDVLMTFIRVAPLAAPIVISALFFNSTGLRVMAGLGVVFLIWVLRPGLRDHGESLARKDAPELHDALDELKAKIDVRGRLEVRLEDELGASAREARGLFGIIGTRRVLTLGLPLLALLGKEETRAVIAHEFGHFSRRHGRLGHWLYWAHHEWLAHAEQIDEESSLLDRAGAVLAEVFAPVFSRRAMVWSRRCEYEADADAARAVGGAAIVAALTRLAVFDKWSIDEFPRLLREWQRTEPAPPDDFLGRMIAAFERASPELLASFASSELTRAGDGLDTRPSLAQRAAALGVEPGLVPREALAGSALLGDYWPTAVADTNTRWRSEHTVAWSVAHARHRLLEAPLLAAEPATAAAWPVAQRLERARAMRRLDPARGLDELGALHAAAPDDRKVTFAWATARLADGDAAAVEILSGLAKDDLLWREPVCDRLAHHFKKIGDRPSAHRWAEQLKTEIERLNRAYASVCDRIAAGKLSPTSRPQPFVETLRAGLDADPAIAKAWLLEGQAQLATAKSAADLPVDALVLVVDPFDAQQKPTYADAVQARQQEVLTGLIGPGALAVVVSYYSTEPLPPALRTVLEHQPSGGIYPR